MSIKSIDSQIMIARTADFSRDTSAMQKRPELAQDHLAFREKINDAQEQSRVAKTLESEMPEIKPDEDGGGNEGYEGGSGQGRDKDSDSDEPGVSMFVPPSIHVIDIRV